MIKKLGIRAFSMYDVDKYGINKVVDMAVSAINPQMDRPLHLSYDIDALDPHFSPSTGTTVFGGLTLREGLHIGELVSTMGVLSALDIVEVNPSIAESQRCVDTTVNTALLVTEACLGKNRSGYISKKSLNFPKRSKDQNDIDVLNAIFKEKRFL